MYRTADLAALVDRRKELAAELHVVEAQIAISRDRRRQVIGGRLAWLAGVAVAMVVPLTAAAFAMLPRLERSRMREARSDALRLRSAAELYRLEYPDAGCPSACEVVATYPRDEWGLRTTDPWGNPFVVRCDDSDVVVTSFVEDECGAGR